MGDRITWRSRPRWDGKLVANEASAPDLVGATGPFKKSQMMELLWRVKALRVSASVSDVVGTSTVTGLIYTRRVVASQDLGAFDFGAEAVRERDLMRDLTAAEVKFYFADADPGYVGSSRFSMLDSDDVWVDGDDYWLGAAANSFALIVADAVAFVNSGAVTLFGDVDVSTGLVFSDGSSVNLQLAAHSAYGPVSAATCSVEIAEWWPYADLAGLPAWDTGTGLKANGGPGG